MYYVFCIYVLIYVLCILCEKYYKPIILLYASQVTQW